MSGGIQFSETMEGGFVLGATEPKIGHAQGDDQDSELAMKVTVHLDDVEAFRDDPEHQGRLTGVIDFTPWGEGFEVRKGLVHLMRPTDDPGLKHMIYQGVIDHEGQAYCVSGYKTIREEGGIFSLWGETTTLYTQLFEGEGTEGTVLGAGILSLGLDELIKLVASMRAVGVDDPLEAARAIRKFGTFFMGQLWDTYGPDLPD